MRRLNIDWGLLVYVFCTAMASAWVGTVYDSFPLGLTLFVTGCVAWDIFNRPPRGGK